MQKITAKKLRFRNFMSFGQQWHEIDFENSVSTFISGENLDNNGKNGCGKTSILNALAYAIYNKPFDNITLPRLINTTNAAKNTLMEVEYTFTKGNEEYIIYRKRGESHGVILTRDGEDITPDSINETDILIEQIYGRSFDLFTRVVVFAGNTTPFLSLPISSQRNHIEELFNISVLSEKAVKLKKIIQTTESDIRVEEAILKEKKSALNIKHQRLANTEQKVVDWEKNTTIKLEKLKEQLKAVDGIDFSEEQRLFELKNSLNQEVYQLNSTISSNKRALLRTEEEIEKLLKQQEHLENDKCPFCLQNMADANQKIKIIEERLLILETEASSAETITVSSLAKLQTINLELTDINSKMTCVDLPELLETQRNFATLQIQFKELEFAENPYFETFEQLETECLEVIDYSRLDELKSNLEHQQFLLKLLTDKNSFIRRRIISKTIPFLNLQMNTYSVQLGLPHIIEFKDDMSCTVSEYGRELDFGNLSMGEKKRVNLAMSLAFRDVMHHLHAKDALLFVDEIDASLDTIGVEAVIKLLNQKTKDDQLSTWVIMHRDSVEDKFDRNLIVRKKGGFSELVWSKEHF